MFTGKTLSLHTLQDNIVELRFDAEGSVNTLNQLALTELAAAIESLEQDKSVQGLVVSSAKDAFIVGADITEFTELFSGPRQQLFDTVAGVHALFNRVEDLPFPTIAAINGFALGGGFELALACDFRLIADKAAVGFPEVKLGIIPGYGGTVRAPRVMGVDNALKWICTGKHAKAGEALSLAAVDGIVAADKLLQSSVKMLLDARSGELNYQARRAEKSQPVLLNDMERTMAFTAAKALVSQQAGPDYPAPMTALKAIEKHCVLDRDGASQVEIEHFVDIAFTDVAASLVGLFLNEQTVAKKARSHAKKAEKVQHAAVLGAGIMGGGIAYQSAVKGIPVLMKDVVQQGLDAGMQEASQLLGKLVERGKMPVKKMAESLNRIDPTLDYAGIDRSDVIVEAVVENPAIKKSVLAECEKHLQDNAVLCSNTSTIRITELAGALARPENFCGMHFFNPVHKMPLVEVIRGEQSSDETIARVVAYASTLGKTPIVVNDCAGFLVNRVLFPYLAAFNQLVHEGADFQVIDRAMEKFGWPMGPAYLLDVVGIDTCVHAAGVLAEAFPDRMGITHTTAMQAMFDADRLGQKNSKGFYQYVPDKRGRIQKTPDEDVGKLLQPHVNAAKDFDGQDIVDRLMIPLCLEIVRCLDEGIVASPAEADMALIMGIGFPMFRGGACRYMNTLGINEFCQRAEEFSGLGEQYKVPDSLRAMAKEGRSFY